MSQFPIDKTDDWEARQDAKRQVTPIPPIPESGVIARQDFDYIMEARATRTPPQEGQ